MREGWTEGKRDDGECRRDGVKRRSSRKGSKRREIRTSEEEREEQRHNKGRE